VPSRVRPVKRAKTKHAADFLLDHLVGLNEHCAWHF
jgi:hypothetical protein